MGVLMRRRFTRASAAILVVCAIGSSMAFGQRKLAQTGMKFLNVGANARMTALGEAFTSVEASSPSMFYNPAGMARLGSMFDAAVGQTTWIADIKHNYGSIAFSPAHGDFGVFGITAISVDYGEMNETIRADNPDGFLDIGKFSPSATMIGLGYAKALSDRFSVGGNVKYVKQNLGGSTVRFDASGNRVKTSNEAEVLAFDLGILYKTGFKSLNFGMAVRNFSKEIKFEKEDFQLPLIFKMGLSMNAVDLFNIDPETHSFLISVDATHPRDYPEQVNVGGEYVFMKILALRAGYMFNNDEFGFTWGVGLQKSFSDLQVGFDYSYTPFGIFTKVQRISLHFSF